MKGLRLFAAGFFPLDRSLSWTVPVPAAPFRGIAAALILLLIPFIGPQPAEASLWASIGQFIIGEASPSSEEPSDLADFESGAPTSPHDQALKGYCSSCHGAHQKPGADAPSSTSSICNSCHQLDFLPSHPMGVVPSMPVPADFPLAKDGTLTCITCHDPHGEDRNLLRRGPYRQKYLDVFCRNCHTISNQNPHAGTFVVAHQKTETPRISADTVDYVSQRCMECHDGVFGPDATVDLTGSSSTMLRELGGSHKVGINYNSALSDPDRRKLDLRPMVSDQISFYEGKVGCLSCHNLYSNLEYRTTVSIRRDELCLSCHDK